MPNEINKIAMLVNEINSLPKISIENAEKLEKKFRLEFNFNSNHIEGNTLTYGETELLLIFDKTEGSHDMREFEEMKAHDVAYKLIKDWAKNIDFHLTEMDIKQLNEIILVQPFYKNAITNDGQQTSRLIKIGAYKEMPNSVRLQNGEIFYYASPIDTPIKMGELIQWYNDETQNKSLTAIELASIFHYKFVVIHPFDDGNGRIARLLLNYILLKNNLPPLIIKSEDKKNYLHALNQADTGNIDAFIQYIAKQLLWSLQITYKATKGENIYETGDMEKRLAVLKVKNNIKLNTIVKKSKEVILEDFEKNIIPLLLKWEEKLLELDFYFDRREFGLNGTFGIWSINSNKITDWIYSLQKQIENYKYNEWSEEAEVYINLFTIYTKFGIKSDGGFIIINYNENNYTINYVNSNEPILKYYTEALTKKEIDTIISSNINFVLDEIEKNS